jgi:hypothetical protein
MEVDLVGLRTLDQAMAGVLVPPFADDDAPIDD